MLLKKYGNLLAGVFFLAFGIVYASQIPAIKITRVSLINSAYYPKILAAALLALAVAQIAVAVIAMRKKAADTAKEDKADYTAVILTLILAIAYVALLEPAGFLISSALYIFFQIIVMCPKDEIRPAKFAVISVIASAVVYFVFRNGLSLMLPAGPLAGIL